MTAHKFVYSAFLFLIIISCGVSVRAEENLNQVNFEKYRAEQIKGILDNAPPPQNTCANPVQKLKFTGYDIIEPIVFPPNAQYPEKGMWFDFMELKMCGDTIEKKLLFKANSGKAPSVFSFLPGRSEASPPLQKDASVMAYVAAMQDKKCSYIPYMIDSDVISKRGNGVWEERWTFKVCGKAKKVRMTFTPDTFGSGTSFKASLE